MIIYRIRSHSRLHRCGSSLPGALTNSHRSDVRWRATGIKNCTMINAWNGLSSGRNGVVGGNHENFLKNRQNVLVNKIFQTKHGSLGSLAQLVQSVCLTSRGSGVRLPQLPQIENQALADIRRCLFRLFSKNRLEKCMALYGVLWHPATAETLQKLYNLLSYEDVNSR